MKSSNPLESFDSNEIILDDKKEKCRRRNVSPATLYSDITKGIDIEPVKISERSSRWPRHETELIIAAQISNKSILEKKELVNFLREARTTLFDRRLKGVSE